MRVALFATCLGDAYFAEACADAVRVLRHLHVKVDFPPAQTCCGQPAFNAGHAEAARRMARHTLDVFEDSEWVVLPSGSCAGMLRKNFTTLLEGADRKRAERLARHTFELAQFIVQVIGVDALGRGLAGRRIAYHHGCHALRELGVRDEPLTLLRGSGAEVLSWEADEECCGFGGLFSVKLPEVSGGMADRKLDTLPDVDVVTSADGGCLMQLSGRAARTGRPTPFRHLATLLREATAR